MTATNAAEHARVNALVYQFAQTYLEKRGWFESLDGIPRNKDGLVPWITYPAFRQLQRTVRPDAKVFEFGCGGSSLWWASRAAEVTSVEHDAAWAARVAETAPANLKVITRVMDEGCSAERQAMVAEFFANPPALPLSHDAGHNVMHGLLCSEFVAYATEICAFEKQIHLRTCGDVQVQVSASTVDLSLETNPRLQVTLIDERFLTHRRRSTSRTRTGRSRRSGRARSRSSGHHARWCG